MSAASSSNRHVSSPLGSTNPPTSINIVSLVCVISGSGTGTGAGSGTDAGFGTGTGAGSGTGTGAGAGTGSGTGSGTGAGADSSLVPDSDGGVAVTPVASVSPVAVASDTGSLVYCLLSCLSFPVPRLAVKSDLTRPQQMMSNTVVAVNRHLLARYSSPIFTIFVGIRLSAL
jgi:hypothetical protein